MEMQNLREEAAALPEDARQQVVSYLKHQASKSKADLLGLIDRAAGWIDATKVPWLQGSWVQSLDKVGTPVVTIAPAAERNWKDLANGYYFAVLLMAATGVFAWFSLRDRRKLLLVLMVAAWTALHLAFMPGSRYHAPLLPLFALWAAAGVLFMWDVVSRAVKSSGRPAAGS